MLQDLVFAMFIGIFTACILVAAGGIFIKIIRFAKEEL